MADDVLQQLLARQSLINSSSGMEGKGAPILMGLRDVKLNSFSLEGKGLNFNKTAPTIAWGKPQPSKLFAAVQSMADDFKKIAGQAGVMYSGDLPTGTRVSSSAPVTGGDGPAIG